MKGFAQDIENQASRNDEFRKVHYTARNCQLVLMALKPLRAPIRDRFAVLVPAGAKHNIVNTGSESLKLCTLYAPPNHRDGVVHHTRVDTPRPIPNTSTARRLSNRSIRFSLRGSTC